jgi:hypothetical protein
MFCKHFLLLYFAIEELIVMLCWIMQNDYFKSIWNFQRREAGHVARNKYEAIKLWLQNLKGIHRVRDLKVDRSNSLRQVLMVCTELIWFIWWRTWLIQLSTGTVADSLVQGSVFSGSIKHREFIHQLSDSLSLTRLCASVTPLTKVAVLIILLYKQCTCHLLHTAHLTRGIRLIPNHKTCCFLSNPYFSWLALYTDHH